MTQNILDQPTDDNLGVDENVNYLEQLVGEGKKFKTPEDLAKGKAQSDHYIKTLENRLDAISTDYRKVLDERNAMPKLQELLDQLTAQQNLQSREPNLNSNEDQNRNALDPEQLKSIARAEFESLTQAQKEAENYKQVQAKLLETLGSNYASVLKEKSLALGLSDDEVNQMVRRNPNLFYKTFDISTNKSNETFQSPPKNVVRNNNFVPKMEKRTLSYYENMRKTNPKLYLDPKIAVQMDKDAQELGEAFFDV